VVLVAHSIGGAIAICMAAANSCWLRGIAVAGSVSDLARRSRVWWVRCSHCGASFHG
jgi:predicted alpha/beta hydrolase family esterase